MELNKYAQLLLEEAKETGCLPVLDRFHCEDTDQYAQISFPSTMRFLPCPSQK